MVSFDKWRCIQLIQQQTLYKKPHKLCNENIILTALQN